MKLHIGGEIARDGWTILDVRPGPDVDVVAHCTDMSVIADGVVERIYASHVFEHLGHRDELPKALLECHRVLRAGGELMVSVPDLARLAALFAADGLSVNQRYELMLMMFGGQRDPHDFHKTGMFEDLLRKYLDAAGFRDIRRVEEFGLFPDSSSLRLGGMLISLNLVALK